MTNGDFQSGSRSAGQMHFAAYQSLLGDTPFQCDGAGNPAPGQCARTDPKPLGANCDKIPANMFDPTGAQTAQALPGQQCEQPALGINYTNVPVRSLNEGEFDVRLDHNFSSKDSIFARFSYDQATTFVPGGSPGFAEQNAFASTQNITNHGRNAALSETHIFSDRTINQVSFGFNRIFNHIKSFGDSTCEVCETRHSRAPTSTARAPGSSSRA